MSVILNQELKEKILNALVPDSRSGEEYRGILKQVNSFMKNIQLIIDNKNIQWMPFNFFTEEDIVELARLFINRKYPDRKLVSNIKNGKMQKVTDSLFSMAKNWADNIDNPYSEIIKSYTSPLND